MRERKVISVLLDSETLAQAEAKAAADHRSLPKYIEYLVLTDLAGPGVPVATILVPEPAEGLTQIKIEGEDPARARRRAAVADTLFHPRKS